MASYSLIRKLTKLAAQSLKPLKKGDPAALLPQYVDGVRVFPPTIDENGNITYYQEFPEGWKPYSYNYTGHGWLIAAQIVLWYGVYSYSKSIEARKEL